MRLADQEPKSALPREGWILYDGGCGFCFRWVHFWKSVVEPRGFAIKDLQSAYADGSLQISQENMLDDIRILTRSGELESGADAYLYVARRIWWAWPFFAIFSFQALIGCSGGAIAGLIEIDTESLVLVRCRKNAWTGTLRKTVSEHLQQHRRAYNAVLRILISAGEASGEMYGAQLIEALHRRDPHLEFFGVGGDRMRAAGCDTVVDAKDLSVVGITEILSHLPKIYGLYKRLIREADRRKPDLAIVIDSPAFNWRVARQMKKRGIPSGLLRRTAVLGMASGTRSPHPRLRRQSAGDLSLRRKVLRDRGVDATFVGHPLADLPNPSILRNDYASQFQLDPAKHWITLMPGSRVKEVRMNLPTILEAAAQLGDAYEFLLPVAPTLDRIFLKSYREPATHYASPRIPARALAFARRHHRQRHGNGRSRNDAHTVRDGLSRLAPHLYAGQAAGQSPALRHGEPDRRRGSCPRTRAAATSRRTKLLPACSEILPDGAPRNRMLEGLTQVKAQACVRRGTPPKIQRRIRRTAPPQFYTDP